MEGSKTHFEPLGIGDQETVLRKVLRLGPSLTLWRKGLETNHSCFLKDMLKEATTLVIEGGAELRGLCDHQVLVKFVLEGEFYFSSGRLRPIENSDDFTLGLSKDFFRCERRGNFRLKLYSSDRVLLTASFEMDQVHEGSGVEVALGEKTRLFHNFLQFIRPKNRSIQGNLESFEFLVRDLSITGLSFWISDFERPLFRPNSMIERLRIRSTHFESFELDVPLVAKVVYVVPVAQSIQAEMRGAELKGQALGEYFEYKVGMEFQGLEELHEQRIQDFLNRALRAFRDAKNFEDFIG